MNIIESNELIAEFMGLSAIRHNHKPNVYEWLDLISGKSMLSTPDQMKFDQSWDWLMPVIHKIQNLPISFRAKNISPLVTWEHRLQTAMWICIDRLYIEVVEFIKWYNENKSK